MSEQADLFMPQKIAAMRAQLQERVERVRASRSMARYSRSSSAAGSCVHEWQIERENVVPDVSGFNGAAHFKVRVCPRCGSRERLAFVVEKAT